MGIYLFFFAHVRVKQVRAVFRQPDANGVF